MRSTANIDVFFCSIGGREDIADTCYHNWPEHIRGAQAFYFLMPDDIHTMPEHFQKLRRVWAEEKAEGEFYIVADDDCLVPQGNWIEQAVAIMERHPDFAILSLMPDNATIQRWTPEGYTVFEDADVMEHVSVGGVRLCRKGVLKSWPVLEGKAYDMAQCQAIRKEGYRVGYFTSIKMHHLGEGKTSLH